MRKYPVAVLLCLLAAQAQSPSSLSSWTLKFGDDFDGGTLNFAKWSPHSPGTLDLGEPAKVTLSGGQAHLASGVMTTFGNFAQTYGRFEIRCRATQAVLRLLPIPSGELPSFDVMDLDAGQITFTTRQPDPRGDREYTGSVKIPSGFHTIAAEWDEEKIAWFVDGVEKFRAFDYVPHQPMYLALINPPDKGALDIDYVRVFARP